MVIKCKLYICIYVGLWRCIIEALLSMIKESKLNNLCLTENFSKLNQTTIFTSSDQIVSRTPEVGSTC